MPNTKGEMFGPDVELKPYIAFANIFLVVES